MRLLFTFTADRHTNVCSLFLALQPPSGSGPPHSRGFLDHTQRCTTVGRTPPDECSARRRNLYLTTHNNLNRQTSMPPAGFEPTISAGERPQTYVFHRADTGTGNGCSIELRTLGPAMDAVLNCGYWDRQWMQY